MSILSRHHRLFESLIILSDALIAGFAFVLAHQLRFSFPELLPFGEVSPSDETPLALDSRNVDMAAGGKNRWTLSKPSC